MHPMKTYILILFVAFCHNLSAQSDDLLIYRKYTIEKYVKEKGMKLRFHSIKHKGKYKKFDVDKDYTLVILCDEDGYCNRVTLDQKGESPPHPKLKSFIPLQIVMKSVYACAINFRFGESGEFSPMPSVELRNSGYYEYLIFEN